MSTDTIRNQREVNAICHYCGLSCGVKATIGEGPDGRRELVKLIGDRSNPVYKGFSCKKGRNLRDYLQHPERLLRPLKRNGGGEFEETDSDTALREIAARLEAIVDKHGPNAVASYNGTTGLVPTVDMMTGAFMEALGSVMRYNTATIDQPGKPLADAMHGIWRGGAWVMPDANAWMLIGTNPQVSKLGGIPAHNPGYYLTRALKRGMKLIVIDPRRSEAARNAHIHLQCKPGEDAVILAGMLRIVIEEGLYDKAFVDAESEGFDTLRHHLSPFTPDKVADRADIPAADLIEAARVFAAGAPKAFANAGTAPNMAPRGTLTEYLLRCLLTVCGCWKRAGDPVSNPGVLNPMGAPRAQATENLPQPWGFPPYLNSKKGFGFGLCGLPTAMLPDEILHDGEERIRALIVMGGNPVMAWPDQLKTEAAMQALELLVVIDPRLTATAHYADYVLAPKLSMEIPTTSLEPESLLKASPSWGFVKPFGQYMPTLVDCPPESDLIADWELPYQLGRHMGLQLTAKSGVYNYPHDPEPVLTPLDMDNSPSTDDLYEIICQGSRIPLSEVKKHPAGAVFDDPKTVVMPKETDCNTRLMIGNELMMAELDQAFEEAFPGDDDFEFRLVSRRTPLLVNSQDRDVKKLWHDKKPYNPAYMAPEDLARYQLQDGDVIEITARTGTILGIVEGEEGLKPGVISMTHAVGPGPDDDPNNPLLGGNTGKLCSHDKDYVEPSSGIPRMSCIPVNISPRAQQRAAG